MTKYAIALTSLLLASGCAYRGEMGTGGASVQTGASVSGGGSETYASSRLMRDNDHHAMLDDQQSGAGIQGSARAANNNNNPRADIDASQADVRDTAEIALHEEQLRVQKQQVPNGGVLLRKVVRSESVSQPIELRREEIQIQRLTADEARGRTDTANAFEGQEIFIPLTREQPVVSKESRVREIVRAGKRIETEQQNIADTVRREDIEIVENVDRSDLQGLGRSSTSVQSGGASSGQESNMRASQQNTTTTTESAIAGQSGPVFRGTIKSVDVENRRLTVEGENGQTMQFTLSDQPNLTIKEHRYPSLIDFKVGYPVTIGYNQSSDGNHVAHSVIRRDAPEVR